MNSERVPASQDGRAYGRRDATSDSVLTQVGPGTPGGELFRRYWLPIAISAEATTTPREIRRLGETLILFRTTDGQPGLLYPRCMHRGTSLFYGKVEEGGIRCCYHGWKYDTQGRCLDQPCEPDRGARSKQHVRQPWYPVIEKYGAIFAYMGPAEHQPAFPRYSIFENLSDSQEVVSFYPSANGELGPDPTDFNWFQFWENNVDTFHVPILHAAISGQQFKDDKMKLLPTLEWYKGKSGASVVADSRRKVPGMNTVYRRLAEALLPNGAALPPFKGDGPGTEIHFAVPLDDTHHTILQIERVDKQNPVRFDAREAIGFGPEKKLWIEMTAGERQHFPSDYEAQRGQGQITLHSEEHLGRTDIGLVMLRRLFKEQCDIVAKGGNPVGVAFTERDALFPVMSASALEPEVAL